jgi:hypothetical protein
LELDLLGPALAFVGHRESGVGRDVEAFTGNPDLERLSGFQAVRQPSQLGHGLFDGVSLFDVSVLS